MTEQTGFPADEKDAQIAQLQAALAEATAAQAVAPEQAAGADAGPQLAQMSIDRPAPLPAELENDKLMAEFKAMSERLNAMEAELGATKAGYAAAVAKLGPPEVAVYGRAILDKLVSYRNAHPDLPPGHFDRVIEAARPLADASQQVIDGTGHVSDVTGGLTNVIDAVERFVTRTHPRTSGKPIDFSALLSDLEYAAEAAAKIAAVA
jgi:hypothetical protein